MKPLKTNWRAQAIPITIFFDDGVGPSSSFEVAISKVVWFVQSVAVSVRRIASVVCQIISMSASCGNVTEIMARSCMLSLIREGPGTTLSSSVNGAGKSFYFGGTIWFL